MLKPSSKLFKLFSGLVWAPIHNSKAYKTDSPFTAPKQRSLVTQRLLATTATCPLGTRCAAHKAPRWSAQEGLDLLLGTP